MKALVVGYGSIGQRHARVLAGLGCEVAVVSRRRVEAPTVFPELAEALQRWSPGYVVVANRTSEHRATIEGLAKAEFTGRVLVEKPLFDAPAPFPEHRFAAVSVAYNLRFHPVMTRLAERVAAATRVTTASVYVGAYLPEWRPGTDYRAGYSASRAQGGGVLRDLSHELDYAHWLFGPWSRLTAAGGHLSTLAIDSDDAFTLLLETRRCPLVTMHLNYLDRPPRRQVIVNLDGHTVVADLVRGTFTVDGEAETLETNRDDTYRAEHEAMLRGDANRGSSVQDALETLLTIDAAERAAASRSWVGR